MYRKSLDQWQFKCDTDSFSNTFKIVKLNPPILYSNIYLLLGICYDTENSGIENFVAAGNLQQGLNGMVQITHNEIEGSFIRSFQYMILCQ